jgi:hypothetical protein
MNHLSRVAQYLPYGIHFWAKGRLWVMTGIDTTSKKPVIASYDRTTKKPEMNFKNLNGKLMANFSLKEIRLILRKPSDILENIKHGGEDVVWSNIFTEGEMLNLRHYKKMVELRRVDKVDLNHYINPVMMKKLMNLHFDINKMLECREAWEYSEQYFN